MNFQLGNCPVQICSVLLYPVNTSPRIEKQAIECNSVCQVPDLSSKHEHVSNIILSFIRAIHLKGNGLLLFKVIIPEHLKMLASPKQLATGNVGGSRHAHRAASTSWAVKCRTPELVPGEPPHRWQSGLDLPCGQVLGGGR